MSAGGSGPATGSNATTCTDGPFYAKLMLQVPRPALTTGSNATTCTDGPFYAKLMLQASDGLPLNFGFSGKGNSSKPEGLVESIQAGCAGLKLHED
ncbi:hypothetical protein T484DRAFT_1864421 [Baffinella frigidus]|nr:hypothetical protein T484DRAFT_1864421 [Cryptophyta sp. CCMP2293]